MGKKIRNRDTARQLGVPGAGRWYRGISRVGRRGVYHGRGNNRRRRREAARNDGFASGLDTGARAGKGKVGFAQTARERGRNEKLNYTRR